MDGGRILRAALWRLSGDFLQASRLAMMVGRAFGWSLMLVGGLALVGLLAGLLNAWSGSWFLVLGLYLNSSAREAWFRAKAAVALRRYKAANLISTHLDTTTPDTRILDLIQRSGPSFLYFVVESDRVVGVVTQKEVRALRPVRQLTALAGDVMVPPARTAVAALHDDGVMLIQRMEEMDAVQLPVIADGRVIGLVTRDDLLGVVQRA